MSTTLSVLLEKTCQINAEMQDLCPILGTGLTSPVRKARIARYQGVCAMAHVKGMVRLWDLDARYPRSRRLIRFVNR